MVLPMFWRFHTEKTSASKYTSLSIFRIDLRSAVTMLPPTIIYQEWPVTESASINMSVMSTGNPVVTLQHGQSNRVVPPVADAFGERMGTVSNPGLRGPLLMMWSRVST